ncbi:DUF5518 domain-containing protein [Natrialbaceae archaeon A-arb3/5]
MVSGRTLVHAIIGAVAGVVLSFIPFSTVIGGAVAGFLEGPDGRDGLLVGLITGAITFVPFAGIMFLVAGALGVGVGAAAVPVEGFAIGLLVLFFASLVVLFYTVGLALLGGYLGAYLAREYPEKRTNTRRTIGMERAEVTDGATPAPRTENATSETHSRDSSHRGRSRTADSSRDEPIERSESGVSPTENDDDPPDRTRWDKDDAEGDDSRDR